MTSYVVCHARATSLGPPIVEYLERIDATLEPHGGRFTVHGGPIELLEGPWVGDLIVLEFPDHESATAWYHSSAYQAIAELRRDNSDSSVLVIDGVDPGHRGADILDRELATTDPAAMPTPVGGQEPMTRSA